MESALPKNWVETELGSIVFPRKGKKPNNLIEEEVDNSIPYILIDQLEGKENRLFTTDKNVTVVDENDVLVVWDGSIGKNASGINGALGSTLVSMTPLGKIPTGFVEYIIKEKQNFIKETSTGVGLQHINKNFFKECIVSLPPLPEQERIVAKLDVLFGQIETIKKSLDKIPQLLKNFRQQVLTQAVTGKLTEKWREGKAENIVKELFDNEMQIREALIKEKKLKNVKKFGNISLKERDLEIADHWLWIRWVDLLAFDNYSMKRGPFGSALKKEFFVENGVRVFEQYNPINDDPYYQRYYVTEQKYQELKSFRADAGDLLISCSGVTLGRITEIPEDTQFGIINQALLKLTLNKKLINNNYFKFLFRSDYIQKKIFENSKGSAIPNMVGVDELKKIPLPIPSKIEQEEILEIIESIYLKADQIQVRYQNLKEKLDQLPQAILHKAFKGELVPQLPTDGDAKDLLKEILALKKELNTKRTKKKSK